MSGVDLLLSAGRGPQECSWAVAQLLERLEAEAAGTDLLVRRLDSVAGDRRDTFRSVLLRISGVGAESFARSWSGTLCWQAPSPYRGKAGRKNWYVIAELCQVDAQHRSFDEADVDVVGCRTGGPGGQHRNKASTAARATHRPTGMVVVVDTERQFSQNRRLAVQLLRHRLATQAQRADRALTTARWQIHDQLVRGNPTRVVRPQPCQPPGSGHRIA